MKTTEKIIVILIYLFFISFFSGFLYEILSKIPFVQNEVLLYYFLVLFLISLIIFLDKKNNHGKIKNYGFFVPSRDHIRMFLTLLSLFFIFSVLSRILFPSFDYWYSQFMGINKSNIINLILIKILIIVLIEDLIFHSLIQRKLKSLCGRNISIIGVTLLFTLIHIPLDPIILEYKITIFLTILIYSFLKTLFFDYTNNLFATFLLHLLLDIIGIIQIILHIEAYIRYELILWFIWGLSFIVFYPKIMSITQEFKKKYSDLIKLKKQQVLLLSIFLLVTFVLLLTLGYYI